MTLFSPRTGHLASLITNNDYCLSRLLVNVVESSNIRELGVLHKHAKEKLFSSSYIDVIRSLDMSFVLKNCRDNLEVKLINVEKFRNMHAINEFFTPCFKLSADYIKWEQFIYSLLI